MEMRFWLVTTDHFEDRLWFRDEEDFITAMNIVAVLSVIMNVKILAFILMSNHVHFVLGCSREDAIEFISGFKKRYSQYYQSKYHIKNNFKRNGIDIREVRIGDESFERAVAYVQMNSVAANICLSASDYPWGTGNVFFRSIQPDGVNAKSFSGRALARIIRSKVQLPTSYIIDNRGFVNPCSYTYTRLVESVFRTPKRMNFFLQNSSKAKKVNEAPSFNDQLVLMGLKGLCSSLFRKENLSELSEDQFSELLKQLRYRFSSDPNQLARVAGLSYKDVCRLLEKI